MRKQRAAWASTAEPSKLKWKHSWGAVSKRPYSHHRPTSFHHHIPIPNQITRFITEIRNPIRHQSVCFT